MWWDWITDDIYTVTYVSYWQTLLKNVKLARHIVEEW